ncbi:hypothetical protein [Paracoccus sp. (in: a-proteobacteria)]|uniref:hypothetical protein n=1 Tax=Paracoccus sp. TaxID=267 RepID=UPI0026E0851E|nr:hypothetical protein [Paracoccus sp. (in: a-proteobacteria)]MDO5646731.1 hypothetical protein [Paracoccus sp. (in: a-proteobacteria)]
MAVKLYAGFGAVALLLAGCVAPMPTTPVVTPAAPVVTAPMPATVLDAASRELARTVINREMQSRMPGANTQPWADCVINNATTAELIDIAQMSRAGASGVGASVATIVSRPATAQCIAAAARTA